MSVTLMATEKEGRKGEKRERWADFRFGCIERVQIISSGPGVCLSNASYSFVVVLTRT